MPGGVFRFQGWSLDRFNKLGVDVGSSTPEAMDDLLRSDTERFVKIFGKADDKK